MRTVKLTTDSTSDLPEELVRQYNIAIIPLYVNFGQSSFKDNVDIDTAGLFRRVKETGALPKTSAPTVADFTAEFQKYIDQDLDILHLSISSQISAAFQNACSAAQQFPAGRIKVIDSQNLSSGIGILVMTAADCLRSGMDLEKTGQTVQSAIARVKVEFIIDTVEYLHKGGRCSGLQMLLSNLLEIHPIIEVADGKMRVAAKIRGNRKVVLSRLVKDALNNIDVIEGKRLFITHCESDDEARVLQKQIADLGKIQQVFITKASCVISSHCGPKTLAIIYLTK